MSLDYSFRRISPAVFSELNEFASVQTRKSVSQARIVMASFAADCCKWVGRVVFFALLATQCGFLVAYPAKYKDNSHWYAMSACYGPTAALLFCLCCLDKAELRWFFFVWASYIYCALLPNVIVVFVCVVENIEKEEFLNPSMLKIVLCFTPLLLLLLVNTADDSHSSSDYRELVARLSVQMAVDLFDAVEMLDIALDDKVHKYGISKEYEIATLVVACFSLFLSPLQMAEIKLSWGEPKPRLKTTIARNIAEMIGVNVAFLVIRVLIFSEYGKDESIFIVKNAIAIILSCLEIYHVARS